ncbi:vacuolar lysine transporter YPQ1-like [Curcuma longa]|uniref:vacuolar lysine transporter YPQ1-like n=1 Tax=Curcuma longa TaxID=136217 RepID=UPI003D9EF160
MELRSSSSCVACVGWIERYFGDCVCSRSSVASFALGIASLLCWGVAEIPQIASNFLNKSGHGVSLAFLLAWVAGDLFNLVGCLLEPVTLPTQLYTAVLYTATTLVLVLQVLYYDHCPSWRKSSGFQSLAQVEDKSCEGLNTKHTQPIPTTVHADLHYMSARSLASSGTPPWSSSSLPYLGQARSGPTTLGYITSSESDGDGSPKHQSRRRVFGSVGYGTFMATSLILPFHSKASTEGLKEQLLQKVVTVPSQGNPYGQLLGWVMAAIYMGGRLPQIYLNIKRGSVEGLNPLMFLFALIANATYVGSILLRSTEWEKIKGNAPWLLDAVVCVLLDLFIILQFAYYKSVQKGESDEEIKQTLV